MNRKLAFFSLLTILVLTISLFAPAIARAEGEPPPEPAPTETPVGSGEGEGVPEPPAEGEQPPDPGTTEQPAQAPEEADLVVVDTESQDVLLVSEQAAPILSNSDPIWCPAADLPGSTNCTSNQASVTDLIAYLLDPDSDPATPTPYTGAGTIYFQDGAYAGPESVITIDNVTLAGLTDLALEGGWDLGSNVKVTDGTTVFSDPMSFNWFNTLQMQDIVIATVYDGYSLYIFSEGDVTLDNVDVSDNLDGSGASIDTCIMEDIDPDPEITTWACTGTGAVTISDSTFDNNAGDGLWVESGGAIDLSTVSASDNGLWGAGLDNSYGTGSVSIDNSTFSNNGSLGLGVWTEGGIDLDTVVADSNTEGADLDAGAAISVTTGEFSDNTYGGLWAETSYGDISLFSVTASNNMQYGAVAGTDEGNIDVIGGLFTGNFTLDPETYGEGVGLEAGTSLGVVNLVNVTASGNDVGAMVGSMDGDVTIITSVFMDNTSIGLEAGTGSGALTLTGVTAGNTPPPPIAPLLAVVADGGQDIGAHLGNLDGTITVTGGFFDGNLAKGLYIESTGGIANPVILDGVEASDNGLKGAYISYLAPCGTTTGGVIVNATGGVYQTNGAYGIYAMVGPEGDLVLDAITPPDFGTDVDTWNGTPPDSLYNYLLNTDVIPCPPPCEPEPKVEPKPYHIVEVPPTGGTPVEQDCAVYAGTILILPTNNKVILSCPATGTVNAAELADSELPGDLPGGPAFLSALEITLMEGDQPIPVILNGGYITVAFKMPEDAKPTDRFAILYWDPAALDGAGDWVELPKYLETLPGISSIFPLHPDADPDDMMRILAGTYQEDGYIKVKVNFPGVFVLIER